MKLLLAFVLTVASLPALADSFVCQLQIDSYKLPPVAVDYPVQEVSVTHGSFSCSGKIADDGRTVTATIRSTQTNEAKSVTSYGQAAIVELTALDTQGDGQDTGICTCGLN